MRREIVCACLVVLCLTVPQAFADIIVDYTVDAGGKNNEPLNGLAARGTFTIYDDELTIVLENTSIGVPASFEAADSLLTSLGMNLPARVEFLSGNAAVVGPNSIGLGPWSDRLPGDSVGEEWIWTNEFGGDLLATYAQVISTSCGVSGTPIRFDGGSGGVDGPSGGIAAAPHPIHLPDSWPAVSNSIRFELTLTAPLSEAELFEVATNSKVEFGSDQRYLETPEPASCVLLLAGLYLCRPRMKRR